MTRALSSPYLLQQIAQSSVLVRGLRKLLVPRRAKGAENTYTVAEAEMPELSKAIADIYASNVRSVSALAKEYGFTAYFFLQPSPLIFGKKNTDLEIQASESRTRNREWEPEFIRLCYQGFRENSYLQAHPGFHDISKIFDGLTEELHFDGEHLLPNGNRIVAERMTREIALPPLPGR